MPCTTHPRFRKSLLAMAASAAPDKFDEVWDEFMTRLDNAQVDRLGELATELVIKTSEWAKK